MGTPEWTQKSKRVLAEIREREADEAKHAASVEWVGVEVLTAPEFRDFPWAVGQKVMELAREQSGLALRVLQQTTWMYTTHFLTCSEKAGGACC